MLLDTVKATLKKHNMLPSEGSILIAASGGLDSTVLTRIISSILKDSNLKVVVCHLNHLLRSEEAQRDELFVKSLAQELGVVFEGKQIDVGKRQGDFPGYSIQQVARAVRFEFFKSISKKYNTKTICLAHHLDDLCENFYLRLFRGSGTMGLSSFSYVGEVDGLKIVRPLLDIPRDDILSYAEENSISFVEDSSNSTDKYDRNKLRNSILPLIKKEFNPSLSSTTKMVVDLIRDDESYFKEVVDEALDSMVYSSDTTHVSIRLNSFLKHHTSIQSRILRELIQKLKGDIIDISYVNIKDVLQIAQSKDKRKEIYLPAGFRVEKLNAILKIYKAN